MCSGVQSIGAFSIRNNCENAMSINTFSVRHSDEKPNKSNNLSLSVQPKNRLHACHGPWAKQTDTTIEHVHLDFRLPTNKKITRIACLIRCQIDVKKIVAFQIKMVIGKSDPNILLYWTSDQAKAVRAKTLFHFHFQRVSRETLHFFGGCLTSAGASANTWNHRAPNHCTYYFSPQWQTWTKTKQNWTYKCWLVPHQPHALQVKTNYLCTGAIESFGTAQFFRNATGCHPQCIEYLICEFSKGCKPVPNLKHKINVQPKPKHGFKSLEQSGVKQQVPTTSTTQPFRRCMQIIQPFHIVAKNKYKSFTKQLKY